MNVSARGSVSTAAAQQLIAGRVSLSDVMSALALARPVFHSEADLQHGFARALWGLDRSVECRLEVRQTGSDRIEHVDLLCIGPLSRTAVEFKYFTRAWSGTVGTGPRSEQYALKSHAANDLARRNFVFDVERLERFCDRADQNGLALMVTNDASLWSEPKASAKRTRDHEFRLHQGRMLTGTLQWAGGAYKENTRVLRGDYRLDWRPYTRQPGVGGEFQYLGLFVVGAGGVAAAEPTGPNTSVPTPTLQPTSPPSAALPPAPTPLA
ncbi:hypothetical protein [Streptacidiphilus cavernicola]|uniref:Restriction endonuclease n=1 Tax=Streptacidiphilus cavernicola TaxID=3342716 RepID=A0ABV6VP63_9ACTN